MEIIPINIVNITLTLWEVSLTDLRGYKTVSVDVKADDRVMHQFRLGKTDGLSCQPLDAGAERQVLVLNPLRVPFADHVP